MAGKVERSVVEGLDAGGFVIDAAPGGDEADRLLVLLALWSVAYCMLIFSGSVIRPPRFALVGNKCA